MTNTAAPSSASGPDDATAADDNDVGDLAQVPGTELEQVGHPTELAEVFRTS
jgi:hypothetical protein